MFLALDRPTHIVASRVMYWGLRSWLRDIGRFGHTVTFVETSDLDAVRDAVRPGETGLFWIETPSNPLWTITDIAAISEIAHSAGRAALRRFDGRDADLHAADLARRRYRRAFGDQISQRPFRRGRRRARHRRAQVDIWERIRMMRAQIGATLGPFEAWLLMRGMRTLHVRVKAQAGDRACCWRSGLTDHPALSAVLYPGLPVPSRP